MNKEVKESKKFVMLPINILNNLKISDGAKLTYCTLLSYARQEGRCYPSQETIAINRGITVKSVYRHLRELKTAGLLSYKQRGYLKSNEYILTTDDRSEMSTQQESDKTVVTGQIEGDQTNTSTSNRTNLSTTDQTSMSDKVNNGNYIRSKNITLTFRDKDLKNYNFEALDIARELNDLENILFYQKIFNDIEKGLVERETVYSTLEFVRGKLNSERVDGKKSIRNPAALFVYHLKRALQVQEDEKERKEKLSKLESLKANLLKKLSYGRDN